MTSPDTKWTSSLLGLALAFCPVVASAQQILDWPVLGQVISEFSASRPDRQGIDILAPMGTPIRASADGQVVYVGNEVQGQGNMLLIKHEENIITAYTAASCVAVRKGHVVQRGQIVAYAGNSGSRDEPAVHFEVYANGKAIDPRRVLLPQAASQYGPHALDGAVLPCVDLEEPVPPSHLNKTNLGKISGGSNKERSSRLGASLRQ